MFSVKTGFEELKKSKQISSNIQQFKIQKFKNTLLIDDIHTYIIRTKMNTKFNFRFKHIKDSRCGRNGKTKWLYP